MCSNYLPSSRDRLTGHFGVSAPASHDAAEAYPASMAPIIRTPGKSAQPGPLECMPAMFGMVPYWADLKLARHTYNARTETVGSKPSFRHAYRQRQFCVVPADAFYEPCYESGKAVRWRISHADGEPLGIAGIWEYRQDGPGGRPLVSFSMLTINADEHPLMRRFHKPEDEKRMLVLLRRDEYESWLHAPLEQAPSFFVPYPADELVAEPAPKAPGGRTNKANQGNQGNHGAPTTGFLL